MAENKYKMNPLKRLGGYIQSAPEKIEQILQHQRTLMRQGEKPLLGELLVSEGLITRSVLQTNPNIQVQTANLIIGYLKTIK